MIDTKSQYIPVRMINTDDFLQTLYENICVGYYEPVQDIVNTLDLEENPDSSPYLCNITTGEE